MSPRKGEETAKSVAYGLRTVHASAEMNAITDTLWLVMMMMRKPETERKAVKKSAPTAVDAQRRKRKPLSKKESKLKYATITKLVAAALARTAVVTTMET